MDNSSLAHTMWTCKYHIVFAPKYRRKIIYKKIREDLQRAMQEERGRNHSWRMLLGPCAYAHQHTAQVQCIGSDGIFKGKKFSHGIRATRESEI